MAIGILKNVKLFAGGYDLTGNSNKLEISAEQEEKDITTFDSYDETTGLVWTECMPGLAKAYISGSGFASYGDDQLDDVLWESKGAMGAFTAYPAGATAGSTAYITNALQCSLAQLGQVGDVAPWSGKWASASPFVRSVGLHNPATARTSSGNGTAVQHVAVTSAQRLYAALNVVSIAGTSTPTLTVKVQSDDGAGFGSATDRITFAAATATGSQWMTAAGPITDDFFRVTWTISGTDPSFLFSVAIGVY